MGETCFKNCLNLQALMTTRTDILPPAAQKDDPNEARSRAREQANAQAALCRVFASATRILILWSLSGGEKSVGEIAAEVGLTMPSTSQHLRLMKMHGVVTARRDGQTIYYRSSGGSCPLVQGTKEGE